MIRNLFTRRAREDARVADFVRAIRLSDRYTVDPGWELQPVPDEDPAPDRVQQPADDTATLPLGLVTLLIPAAR